MTSYSKAKWSADDIDVRAVAHEVGDIHERLVSLEERLDKPTFFVRPADQRPPREDYVRITIDWRGFTIEPGLEYRNGDHFPTVAAEMRSTVQTYGWDNDTPMTVAHTIADALVAHWPDRAYFVEVWQEGREGFAQVFQPFGLPRNR